MFLSNDESEMRETAAERSLTCDHMRVGFILQDKKKPRVLTAALQAHAVEHGLILLSLNPSDPTQWEADQLHAIVHKLPEDAGFASRLLAFQQQHPHVKLLDAPAAVHLLQDRGSMLRPLAGPPLVLLQDKQEHSKCQAQKVSSLHGVTPQRCIISVPPQAALPAGCDLDQALQLLQAAGLKDALEQRRPLLAKLAFTATSAGAGHTLGAVTTLDGLQQLLQGAVEDLQLPVVLQEFVPHGPALYKLYVIGPHVVLTARSTLTAQSLQAAATSAETSSQGQPAPGATSSSHPGVVILNRISAEPLAATAAVGHDTPNDGSAIVLENAADGCCTGSHGAGDARSADSLGEVQQQEQQQLPHQHQLATDNTSSEFGVALCDASAADQPDTPPMWAMQQLAAHLRLCYGLNMFNVDIIAPDVATAAGAMCIRRVMGQLQAQPFEQAMQEAQPPLLPKQHQQQQCRQGQVADWAAVASADGDESYGAVLVEGSGDRCYLAVDVNYFPGYDKIPGAESLFADFLSSVRQK